MNNIDIVKYLKCPLCSSLLSNNGNSLICNGERRHTFDLAKSGYVNFNTHLPTSGDDKEMSKARQAFLRKGYYRPLADAIQKACGNGEFLIDCGCGEGFYTEFTTKNYEQVLGIDLSKHTIELAAKSAKRESLDKKILYSTASVYDIPTLDNSCDCVLSVFAPCASEEFYRVMKDGATLVIAAAGTNHLHELKEVLYDSVIPNDTRRDYPENMTLIESSNIKYRAVIEKDDIYPLFTMTPYFFKTKREKAQNLLSLDRLETTLDFEIRVYKKEV